MRCLILIALCAALACATPYYNKNRFYKLLNRYQNRYDLDDNLFGKQYGARHGDLYGNLYGSDEVDDFVDDYVDEIRRERMLERDQCPRDILDILEESDMTDFEDNMQGRRGYNDLLGRDLLGRDFEDMRGRRGLEDLLDRNTYDDLLGRDYEDILGRKPFGRRSFEEREFEDRQPLFEDRESLYENEHEIRSPLLKEVEVANTKLATKLYKESKDEKDDKNIVVSPLSIQLALAALNYGTRGNTKRQIGRVIAGSLSKQERRQVFKTLVRHLKGYRNVEYSPLERKAKINTVTGIFVSKTTPAQQAFMQLVKGNLGAVVRACNFQRQPQQCRQMINQLIAQKTQGKLAHIVPQDAITDNTKMILVNAMHMKANWGPQMRQHITKEAKFYPLDTKKVKIVEVMETEGRFKYHEDALVKIVGVPTEQKELTLYVIVPKEKDGLTEVEKLHLQDSVQLKQLLDVTDKHVRRVGVQLPKFQIKHKIDVRRTLRKQGVTDAFDPLRADFSAMTGIRKYETEEQLENNPFRHNSLFERETMEEEIFGGYTGKQETKLHLNKFIHQSIIKITENGITATTGSGNQFEQIEHERTRFGRLGGLESEELNMFDEITGFNRREMSSQKMVKANHAFAFVVKHNPTNQLVFVGRVIDAAQKKVNNVPQSINVVDQL